MKHMILFGRLSTHAG